MDIQEYKNPFQKVVDIVEQARQRMFQNVNTELIKMYWSIGEYISEQTSKASYGDAFVNQLAEFIANNYPDIKGFNRRGLYRMRQFYETYKNEEKVSTLLTQLTWSNHLKILSGCKTMDERIFYMNMSVKEKYSARELERQINSGYYERYMLSENPQTLALKQANEETRKVFLDTYVLEFLNVHDTVSEYDLKKIYHKKSKRFYS